MRERGRKRETKTGRERDKEMTRERQRDDKKERQRDDESERQRDNERNRPAVQHYYLVQGSLPTSVPRLTSMLTTTGLAIMFSMSGLSSGLRWSMELMRSRRPSL